jgi:hypothetical protein
MGRDERLPILEESLPDAGHDGGLRSNGAASARIPRGASQIRATMPRDSATSIERTRRL